MKRLTRYSLAVLSVLLLVSASLAFVIWATATTKGNSWLLKTIPTLTGVDVTVRKIEGSIANNLLLTGVRLTLEQQQVEIDTIKLRWKPLLLLAGTVGVSELTLTGVRIQDDSVSDDKPPLLEWPRAPQRALLLNGVIERLQVTGLSYRRRQEAPLTDASLTASVSWDEGVLALNNMMAGLPAGRVNGSISAGFGRPALAADLTVIPAEEVEGMDRLRLRLRPGKSEGAEKLAVFITLDGSAGTRKLLELNGEAGMERNLFNLRRLSLSRAGQKGELTADGSLAFKDSEALVALRLGVQSLDLNPQLNIATDLSGTLTFRGTLDGYGGNISLTNRGESWRTMVINADYSGNRDRLKLTPANASILGGSLTGNLVFNWSNGFAMEGNISGKNLNPARLDPAWNGLVNFTASGNLEKAEGKPLSGKVQCTLLNSLLHGHALTGELKADISGDKLYLSGLSLRGKGFDLQGSGDIQERLTFAARITDLSRLVPKTAGSVQAGGWVRWRDRKLSGAVTASGKTLAFAGTRVAGASLNAHLYEGAAYPFNLSTSLRKLTHEGYEVQTIRLSAQGTLHGHDVDATLSSGNAEARINMAAGYSKGAWSGELNRFSGNDGTGPWALNKPARFNVSATHFTLAPALLVSGTAEHLEVAANLALEPLTGEARVAWNSLNLSRINSFLKDGQAAGISNGKVHVNFLNGKNVSVAASASGTGTFTAQGIKTPIIKSRITVSGNGQGVHADMEVTTADGGQVKANFSSPQALALELPGTGKLSAELREIDAALLTPWLPDGTSLKGSISGRADGTIMPGQRFALDGSAVLSGGSFRQARPDGELNISLSSAKASWGWRGEALDGSIDLAMAEHGRARATFQLPIPAALPLAVNPNGRLHGSLVGQAMGKGLITALFPELVQESFGELNVNIGLNGTWDQPGFSGRMKLVGGGAYLPTAGIRLKDVELAARLEKDLIRIDSFRAVSGPGHLDGTALITLKGGRVTSYQGTIGGENFQAVHLPEFSVLATPRLTFEGDLHRLKLRGELLLPEVQIISAPSRNVITPSGDVIFEGKEIPAPQGSDQRLLLDARIKVRLGEQVFVKTGGIDAQLGGSVDLSFNSLDSITSAGEIRVVKGRYQTYGVNLEIVRGRLFFAGGPIDSPTIDFLALRTIGDVKAGVTVSGTPQKPVTRLYSQPTMPDVDILAYIVLGHPLGSRGEQASVMAQAAGALLTSGQAAVVQQKIKKHLGLSILEIQSGTIGSATSTSYKPLQSAGAESRQSGVSETILTVGKYLTPQIYVSYGKSLFSGSNIFRLRYDIYKQWQIETQTGSESGADLFYKLEFK